ncbi:hypothetical protein BDV11DRAFT_198223, partial [Aspergillus similis]
MKLLKSYKLPIQIVVRRSRPSMQSSTTDIDYITTSIIHNWLWAGISGALYGTTYILSAGLHTGFTLALAWDPSGAF